MLPRVPVSSALVSLLKECAELPPPIPDFLQSLTTTNPQSPIPNHLV